MEKRLRQKFVLVAMLSVAAALALIVRITVIDELLTLRRDPECKFFFSFYHFSVFTSCFSLEPLCFP